MNPNPPDIAHTGEEAPQRRGSAYSYVRFSTSKQELGDSLRRQVAMAEQYCTRHGLDLHPVSYRDLGVSGFRRQNIEKGALAAFIQAVRSGKVAKGSYLVIEQFDRLSRADTNTALRLLLDLVDAGIKVVTLVDEKIWDKETIKDTTNLIIAIVYMSRANNESEAKAKRLSDVWGEKKRKAATGEAKSIVTSECPRWLAPNADRSGFVVLEDKAESVRKVFSSRIGGKGMGAITTLANRERWPIPGKPPVRKPGESPEDFQVRTASSAANPNWHTSTVQRILSNRAVLGEYQPHINSPDDEHKRIPVGDPIQDYYPKILDEITFLRAQAKAERDGRFPGRRDASLKNWLQGILRCKCGNSMVRKNKNSQAQPGYARYYCSARNRGTSSCPGANAQEMEGAVLKVVSVVAPAYFQGSARMETLKARIDVLEVEVSVARLARDRYVEAIGASKATVASLLGPLGEAESALLKCEQELFAARTEMSDLSGDSDAVFENILKAVENIDSLDARAALREELSRVISKAVVHQEDGYMEVHLRGLSTAVRQPLRPDAVSIPGITFNQVSRKEYEQLYPRRSPLE